MRILIGYAMRSGSTLLQHILNEHSRLRSCSDISSIRYMLQLRLGMRLPDNICVKPIDLVYLYGMKWFYHGFDKFIWIARDPRDSYLSGVESKYAYLFRPRGPWENEIDVGLIERWKRVYKQYFQYQDRWHLVRYEDLVSDPDLALGNLLDYLELPHEQMIPFRKFSLVSGGDYKLAGHNTVHTQSKARHLRQMTDTQRALFNARAGQEMQALGYAG
jgi:hypothetical protein